MCAKGNLALASMAAAVIAGIAASTAAIQGKPSIKVGSKMIEKNDLWAFSAVTILFAKYQASACRAAKMAGMKAP